ncbi:hypothetical protein C815_02263 [Firmicutes bacterium M10-2]|nr:hypothetical protein C815_02263 [Firmicutes bacterium M10-2]
MNIEKITPNHPLFQKTVKYALSCPWKAGTHLGQKMRDGQLKEGEMVFAAIEESQVYGFIMIGMTDCLDVPYSPFLRYLFVDETKRGHRLGQQLIDYACMHIDRDTVYLISDHIGLYEKYGFVPFESYPAPWDEKKQETIFIKKL